MKPEKTQKPRTAIIWFLLFTGIAVAVTAIPVTATETAIAEDLPDTLETDTQALDTTDTLILDSLPEYDSTVTDSTDTASVEETEVTFTLEDTIGILQAALKQEFWPKNVISTVILADTNVEYSWLPDIEGIHFIIMNKKRRSEKVERSGDFVYHRIGEIERTDTTTIIRVHYEWEPPRSEDPTYLEVWLKKDKGSWHADKVFHYREIQN
ncbi:hypothetical protein GF359_01300 [candidate division WOR-3 bacterium]|uniref:Uncharacterized protein n=1 Tax=candidate division WOR-3 bacterium TaxID=2052148 RepID=A0A9D5K9M6_UNCW3|nr:hypothetical protein [candidate division WOR-3 bacterium]MBD3363831.1 hypothetical protein [candidate division WOR-3 bacterium]